MKLRKCFCGGKPKHYPLDFPEVYNVEMSHVECDKCGYSTLSYFDGNNAMKDWNYLQRKKIKLKPCPWCKSRNLETVQIIDDYTVTCCNCAATGPEDKSEKEANKLWNKRKTND